MWAKQLRYVAKYHRHDSRSKGTSVGDIRFGGINLHTNGLMNVQGTAVAWDRQCHPELGLLRAMRDFNFAAVSLPSCKVFEDFALPAAMGADLTAVGGVSDASVGVLRPLEVALQSCILEDLDGLSALFAVFDDTIIVFFALPTPSGIDSDRKWVEEFRRGREAGCAAAGRLGTEKVIWMGDFNFEPASIRGRMDPRKACPAEWAQAVSQPRMFLMNPCVDEWQDEVEQDVKLEEQCKVIRASV